MNLKVLFLLLLYYSVIGLFYTFGVAYMGDSSTNVVLNSSQMGGQELDKGGVFTTGVDVARFVGFVTFGIIPNSDTPAYFSIPFMLWQSIFSIFTIGFIISSIWNG